MTDDALRARMFDGRIVHVARRSRLEAHDGGGMVGYLQYGVRGRWAVLARTEVRDHARRDVVARALVMAGLALMRSRGHNILAVCPRVKAHLAEQRDVAAFPDPADDPGDLTPLDLTA